jgi:hypothetical protein
MYVEIAKRTQIYSVAVRVGRHRGRWWISRDTCYAAAAMNTVYER